jgi:hypothetical protein
MDHHHRNCNTMYAPPQLQLYHHCNTQVIADNIIKIHQTMRPITLPGEQRIMSNNQVPIQVQQQIDKQTPIQVQQQIEAVKAVAVVKITIREKMLDSKREIKIKI